VLAYRDFMKQRIPEGAVDDANYSYAFATVHTLVQVLKQCGDDLTRANIMRQVANLRDLVVPMLLPGVAAAAATLRRTRDPESSRRFLSSQPGSV